MSQIQFIVDIVMFFTLFVFLYTNFYTQVYDRKQKQSLCALFSIYIFPFLCFVYIALFHIPLPLFYLVMYVLNYFTIRAIYKRAKGFWLLVNTYYLSFATPHLITLGAISIFTGDTIPELLEDAVFRAIILIITLCIEIIINSVLRQFFNKSAIHFLGLESEEFQLFSSFLWFCTLFVTLDSIPCLSDLPIVLSGLFMIGCNLLLSMMLYLFARHIYTIAHNSYVKEELAYMKLEEAKQHDRTKVWERKAYIDNLTGAYTRTYAISNITAMLQNNEKFVIAFLDLDDLKVVNDEQGHMQGDMYLKRFVDHMKSYLRVNDVLARLGGDEFLVIMPEFSKESAEQLFKECRNAGKDTPFSYGVVAVPPKTDIGAELWIAQADHLMYEDKLQHKGKRGGR